MTSNLYIYANDNIVIGSNGVFSMGYEIELSEKYSLGEEDYIILNDTWNRALKDMPTGSLFVKNDVFLNEKVDVSKLPEENFLQKATKAHFKNRQYLNHKAYIFFVLPPSFEVFNDKISNPFKRLYKKHFEGFDNRINSFVIVVEQIVSYLNSVKINSGEAFKLKKLNTNTIMSYYEYYFNNFNNNYVTDRFVENGYLKIGDRYLGAICTRDEDSFPEEIQELQTDKKFTTAKYKFFQNIADNFTFDLKFDHVYNQIICFEDNQSQLSKLRKNQDLLKKSASFDPQNKVNAKKLEKLINEIANDIDQNRIVKGHVNVLFYADNIDDIKLRRNEVVEKFRALDITVRQPLGNFLNSTFTNSFHLFAYNFSERQLFYCNLEFFTPFINNCTNYKNDEKGVLFNSRLDNVPVVFDNWDDEKKYMNARNFMIIAPTGYGKSFFANHLFRQCYENNDRIVIIDLGGSYKKLAALYPNDSIFIQYNEGKPIGLNPFDLQGENLSANKIEDVSEFVLTHYKRDTQPNENERSAMRKIIEAYYLAGENLNLIDFIGSVRIHRTTLLNDLDIKEEYFDIDEFLFLMSEFEENGIYSFLYSEKNNNQIENLKDKKIIVFELDEVKDNALLLNVMLQLISSVINEVVWKDVKTKSYVFFDEVAKQFKFKGVLQKIEYFYQAIRKQNGSVGMILQSISQLPDMGEQGQISKTIIENTQLLYVLNAKDYRLIQSKFGLSEHAYNQMCSVQSDFKSEIKFSEFFALREKHHQVYRLEVPNEVFWAYQTEGAKNQELIHLYQEIGDMEEAINQYINQQ